jgi:hypothetical protein
VGQGAKPTRRTVTQAESGDLATDNPPIRGCEKSRSGAVGAKVLIRGDHFIGASAVAFISATAPAGAISGPIVVTNPGGKTISAGTFSVE